MGEVNPYDLVEVQIGVEVVRARPIEWDIPPLGEDGSINFSSKPVKLETTCPACGQMVVIPAGSPSARCPLCLVGVEVKVVIDTFENPFCLPGDYDQ